MLTFTRSSAYSVFKNTREKRDDTCRLYLHAAKNALCAGQLVLRDHADFEITGVSFENFSAPFIIDENDVKFYYQDYIRYNDGEYPDILSDKEVCHISAECSQSVWVVVDVRADALSGVCRFDAVIKTSVGEFVFPCSVKVYGVTVPDADKSSFCLEYFLDPFTPEMGERWGEGRLKFLSSYADSLTMIRNNSLDVCVIPLLTDGNSKRVGETEWALDFTYVEKYIDFMIQRVPTKRIAIRSVIACVNGDTLPVIDYDGSVFDEKYGTAVSEDRKSVV